MPIIYKSNKIEKEPKKRGRKKKEKREQRLLEKPKAQVQFCRTMKKFEDQLELSLKKFPSSVPIEPLNRLTQLQLSVTA